MLQEEATFSANHVIFKPQTIHFDSFDMHRKFTACQYEVLHLAIRSPEVAVVAV